MSDSIVLFIPYIAKSTNAMYAGQHWSERKRHKAEAAKAVIVALSKSWPAKIDLPVDIEDCLVSRGVLVNDSPAYVQSVKFCAPVRADLTGIELVIKTIQSIAK